MIALRTMKAIIVVGAVAIWFRWASRHCPYALWMWGGHRIKSDVTRKGPVALLALEMDECNVRTAAALVPEMMIGDDISEQLVLNDGGTKLAVGMDAVFRAGAEGNVSWIAADKAIWDLWEEAAHRLVPSGLPPVADDRK